MVLSIIITSDTIVTQNRQDAREMLENYKNMLWDYIANIGVQCYNIDKCERVMIDVNKRINKKLRQENRCRFVRIFINGQI